MHTETQTLLPGQQFVVAAGFIDSSQQSYLLEMPTGSGKTWLGEQAIRHVLETTQRVAVYLSPLKALSNNQFGEWETTFAGYPIGIFDGDHREDELMNQCRVMIMTPECFEACLRAPTLHKEWVHNVALVVIDEIHLLADSWRGARLEGALLAMQILSPWVRLAGISATLGEATTIAQWLEARFLKSTVRPVPLRWQQIRFWSGEQKQQRVLTYLLQATEQNHQCLVFCQSRSRTEALAKLYRSHQIAAACHHAGLSMAERQAAEEQFKQGKVRVLCATTTLALGVNLPVREVIIYDTQRPIGKGVFQPITQRDCLQMAGRAGRPGFDPEGVVTLVCHEREAAHWQQAQHQPQLEPIRSALESPSHCAERLLTALSGQYANTPQQLKRLLARTLAATQGILPDIDQLLQDMTAAGMIEVQHSPKTTYQVTNLGATAVRHYLQPQTATHFQSWLRYEPLALLDLIIILVSAPDHAPLLPAQAEQWTAVLPYLSETPSHLLLDSTTLQSTLKLEDYAYLRVLYTSAVLYAWTQGGDLGSLVTTLGLYEQDVQRALSSVLRLLEALTELCTLLATPKPQGSGCSTPAKLEALQKMLTTGLNERAVTLLYIPGLTPVKAKQLLQQGITDSSKLAAQTPATLGLTPQAAAKLLRYAKAVAKQVPGDQFVRTQSDTAAATARQALKQLWLRTQTQQWQR